MRGGKRAGAGCYSVYPEVHGGTMRIYLHKNVTHRSPVSGWEGTRYSFAQPVERPGLVPVSLNTNGWEVEQSIVGYVEVECMDDEEGGTDEVCVEGQWYLLSQEVYVYGAWHALYYRRDFEEADADGQLSLCSPLGERVLIPFTALEPEAV